MKIIIQIIICFNIIFSQKLKIPMDNVQSNHLKAYGLAFWILEKNINVDWMLNYRGGAFMFDSNEVIIQECILRGITYEIVNAEDLINIYSTIEDNNMDIVLLEKAPKIAVYSPKDKQPWDDAVTLALTYAEVDYETIFDYEVLDGELSKYDWLHLHHEDFTGQYGKFYRSFRNASWYKEQENKFNQIASSRGFKSVHELKKNIALNIKNYIINGGFIFAMCSATDSFDIALASLETDIAASVFDGTPIDPNYQSKLNFKNSLAFENYQLYTDPYIYEYSTIDSSKPFTKYKRSGSRLLYVI